MRIGLRQIDAVTVEWLQTAARDPGQSGNVVARSYLAPEFQCGLAGNHDAAAGRHR